MKRWEASADVHVVNPDLPGQSRVVEAILQSLTRDFGACFAIPLLHDRDFLERYPKLLDGFWKFDNDMFPMMMIGIPPWAPFRMIWEGRAGRSRLLQELAALYRRVYQYQCGETVEFGADMSDISDVVLERSRVYEREGWSLEERGGGDLAIFWGQNANTQPVLFWLLTHAYSTPGLLDRLRRDIEPYIKLAQSNTRKIASMDFAGLFRNGQLLKACLNETYRMVNEPTSVRYVASPVTIDDGTYRHDLKPGMFVPAPHALRQRDAAVYESPDKFIPDRFLETDSEAGRLVARYKGLRPWGSGAGICKDRTFAEKEIMLLSAAVMSLWDIHSADSSWKLPVLVPGTGVKRPVTDICVRISQRTL